ncbi:hypothetical protein IJ541_10765 [bacterium]|nr:hypothetical protein [bacterium]
MKKFILFAVFLLLSFNLGYGQDMEFDSVYFEPQNKLQYNLNSPEQQAKQEYKEFDKSEVKVKQPLNSSNISGEYSKKSASYIKEKKLNDNMTVGAKYDTTFSPEQANQTRTLYSNYSISDNFSINTSYKNETLNGANQQLQGSFSFTPEYKINQNLSIQNAYTRNIGSKSNKGEVLLKVKPFKDDRMDFNVGAGQVQYDSGEPAHSQFSVGTNFKF